MQCYLSNVKLQFSSFPFNLYTIDLFAVIYTYKPYILYTGTPYHIYRVRFFFRKLKSDSEICIRTTDPLRIRASLWWTVDTGNGQLWRSLIFFTPTPLLSLKNKTPASGMNPDNTKFMTPVPV